MYIIISFAFLAFAILQAWIEKKVYNPLTLFLGIWAIICFLPGLHLFGLNKFREDGYMIVVVGVMGFSTGYLLLRHTKKPIRLVFGKKHRLGEYELRTKLLLICTIGMLFCYFIMALRVAVAMKVMGLSYANMRTLYMRGTDAQKQLLIYGSGMLQSLEYFIFRPMFYAGIAVTIARYCNKMKYDIQIILMIATVFCYVLVNFGRVILFELVGCILMGLCITGVKLNKQQKKRLKKIILRYILPGIVVVFLVMKSISASRKAEYSNATSLIEELYAYFAIPLPLLGYWKAKIDAAGDMSYGLMFAKGIVNFFMIFLGKIGIPSKFFSHASEIVNETETFIRLFPKHSYNAYVSMFYYFYVDGRLLGVFFGSAIYGSVFGYIFKHLIRKNYQKTLIRMSLFLLLFESFTKCFIRWEFVQMTYALSYLWIFIWFKYQKPATSNRTLSIVETKSEEIKY